MGHIYCNLVHKQNEVPIHWSSLLNVHILYASKCFQTNCHVKKHWGDKTLFKEYKLGLGHMQLQQL